MPIAARRPAQPIPLTASTAPQVWAPNERGLWRCAKRATPGDVAAVADELGDSRATAGTASAFLALKVTERAGVVSVGAAWADTALGVLCYTELQDSRALPAVRALMPQAGAAECIYEKGALR